MTKTSSRGATSRSMPRRTSTAPKDLRSPRIDRTGGTASSPDFGTAQPQRGVCAVAS